MCRKLFVVFVMTLVTTQLSGAPNVPKCKASDSKCMKASAETLAPAFAAGIPELNVASLDPLHMEVMDASTQNLKLILRDSLVTGLRKCEMKKVERNVAKSKILVTVLCDVNVDGKYELDGHILILQMQGEGDGHVQLNKLLIDIDANIVEKTDKQGVKHWDIKSFSHSFELQDNAKIRMENLFHGNKELAAVAMTLFDDNANEVVNEVGVPIVKSIVTEVVKNVNHFFHRVPAEDLYID